MEHRLAMSSHLRLGLFISSALSCAVLCGLLVLSLFGLEHVAEVGAIDNIGEFCKFASRDNQLSKIMVS
jgi:hypothetical protein